MHWSREFAAPLIISNRPSSAKRPHTEALDLVKTVVPPYSSIAFRTCSPDSAVLWVPRQEVGQFPHFEPGYTREQMPWGLRRPIQSRGTLDKVTFTGVSNQSLKRKRETKPIEDGFLPTPVFLPVSLRWKWLRSSCPCPQHWRQMRKLSRVTKEGPIISNTYTYFSLEHTLGSSILTQVVIYLHKVMHLSRPESAV